MPDELSGVLSPSAFRRNHHRRPSSSLPNNDTDVISPDPDIGLNDQGIYRFVYRSKAKTNIDTRNATHRARPCHPEP